MKKIYIIGIIIIGLVISIAIISKPATKLVGGAAYKPTFQAVGTTNTQVTVNTTSTTVARGYVNIAVITTGATPISCSLDDKTAASSSATAGIGIVIPANSKTSFGPLGDIPFLGAINCVATATTSVGVILN